MTSGSAIRVTMRLRGVATASTRRRSVSDALSTSVETGILSGHKAVVLVVACHETHTATMKLGENARQPGAILDRVVDQERLATMGCPRGAHEDRLGIAGCRGDDVRTITPESLSQRSAGL